MSNNEKDFKESERYRKTANGIVIGAISFLAFFLFRLSDVTEIFSWLALAIFVVACFYTIIANNDRNLKK